MRRSFVPGVLFVLSALAGCGTTTQQTPPAAATPQPAAVVSTAKVLPIRSSNLVFQTTGTVATIAASEGQTVTKDTALAQLVTDDLTLAVAAAEASVRDAQAQYDQIAAGATEAEIAAGQALVAQASADARRVQGSVTGADIQAARERLAQAQANLTSLGASGDTPQIQTARANLAAAQTQLQSQRDTLSRAKTRADAAIASSAQSLTKAQASYAEAASNWQYVLDTGRDPRQPSKQNSQGKLVDNKLEDAQREQYYAAFVQAEASLRQAEQSVAETQTDAEQARKAELVGIQSAETQVAAAQTALDELLTGGADASRAAARAALADAQANLAKLTGEQRASDLARADASVKNAQANLEKLTAPTRAVDLARAEAGIAAAQVRLQQAQLTLTKATLRAPFAGTIAQVNLNIGEAVSGASGAAVVLGDTSAWKIETDNLTEQEVVRFPEGAVAQLSFDALPDLRLSGKVTRIQPIGKDKFGDATYIVTVTPDTWDSRLRWNMTANVSIPIRS